MAAFDYAALIITNLGILKILDFRFAILRFFFPLLNYRLQHFLEPSSRDR